MEPSSKPSACQGCGLYARPLVSYDGSRSPDILIVAGFPNEADTTRGAFTSRSGAIIRSLVSELRKLYGATEVAYTYAVRCFPEGIKPSVKVEDITQCRPFLELSLQQCNPKILLLLGTDAMKSVGVRSKLSDARGVRTTVRVGETTVPVLPTFSMPMLMAKPGLLPVLKGDMEKAFAFVKGIQTGVETLSVKVGKTWPEILGILDEVQATIDASYAATGKPRLVSIDTETTSLTPYMPGHRVFCISFSVENNEGYAIRFDRKNFNVTDEEFASLPEDAQALVCNPERFEILKARLEACFGDPRKVHLAEYNAKFDTQWLTMNYGLRLADVQLDPMLWEHALCEDKKGEYGLKDLTVDYFPSYAKYESDLQLELEALKTGKEARYDAIEKANREAELLLKQDAFARLSPDSKATLLGQLGNQGLLTMEEVLGMASLKEAKPRKVLVFPSDGVRFAWEQVKLVMGGTEKSLEVFVTNCFKTKKAQDRIRAVLASGEVSPQAVDLLTGYEPTFETTNGLSQKSKDLLKKVVRRIPRDLLVTEENPVVIPDKEEFTAVTYEELPEDALMHYAAVDAVLTRKLVPLHIAQARKDAERIASVGSKVGAALPTKPLGWAMQNITMPLCRTLARMEYGGVRIDRDKLRMYIPVLDEKLEEYSGLLRQHVGKKGFNPNSSQELASYLFDTLKLPVLKVSDSSGAPSVDADTLKELADNHPSEFLDTLLAYRKINMCRHTFLENWDTKSAQDGKLHCQFHQVGTATHRLSSSNPNLQNVPFYLKEAKLNLKALFIPDSEDFDIYDLDISNAEMRVLAGYSNDANLITVFNSNMDMHCLTGSAISEYAYEDIYANKENKGTPQYSMRQIAKTVNFGTVYCMSNKTLQRNLWTKMRVSVSEEESQSYLDKFFEKYPGVLLYIDNTKAFVRRFGFHYTFTGRRRRFPVALHSSAMASRVSRQAVNARIQTTSSDLVNMNLVDLEQEVLRLGGRVLLTVHDSILFQLPKNQSGLKAMLDEVIITRTAKRNPWLPVRWEYSVGRGPSYGEAKDPVVD